MQGSAGFAKSADRHSGSAGKSHRAGCCCCPVMSLNALQVWFRLSRTLRNSDRPCCRHDLRQVDLVFSCETARAAPGVPCAVLASRANTPEHLQSNPPTPSHKLTDLTILSLGAGSVVPQLWSPWNARGPRLRAGHTVFCGVAASGRTVRAL